MLSLDKRQMFPRPLFCMHFRNNDFTILFSQSILMADDGEDSGTTVDVRKEGEATNAFSIHSRTVSCSYHSPAASNSVSALQLPFPCSSHTQTVPCSYHSPAAPTPRQCLAVTIPLQLPHS